MEAIKIWFISGWINLVIGFVIGWIVFRQPQWAVNILQKFWAWIKAKLHLA